MKTKLISGKASQVLKFDKDVEVVPCHDEEFKDLICLKIGNNLYLPSIEWTKYQPPEPGEEAGSFDPVEGDEWELLYHAIEDDQMKVEVKQ